MKTKRRQHEDHHRFTRAITFCDFVGTIRHPITKVYLPLMFEAKSTKTHRLALGKQSGLTGAQVMAMADWQSAGAVVGLLWYCQKANAVAWIDAEDILDRSGDGAVSLRFYDFEDAVVPPGRGVRYDFAKIALSALSKLSKMPPKSRSWQTVRR